MKRWLPLVAGVVAAAVFGAVAYALANGDIDNAGDWRNGVQRFIGFAGALGLFGGYVVTARLTRGARVTRGGFTLTYPTIVPRPESYREVTTLTVADLETRLRDVGYVSVNPPRVTRAPRVSLAVTT